MKYVNHTGDFYSFTYNKFVNIRYPHVKNLLNHEIVFKNNKEFSKLIIPSTPLSSFELNTLYVYSENLSLVYNYVRLGISLRDREIAISRVKNKLKLISNDIGSFYFAENPNSYKWKGYQEGKYPLIKKYIVTDENKFFNSKKIIQNYLLLLLSVKSYPRTVIRHLINGTICRKRYLFFSGE